MSVPLKPPASAATAPLGLGLDAGGTQTRWALAEAGGHLLAEGHVAGISGLQLATAPGRVALAQTAHQLAAAVLPHGRPGGLYAGITGVGEAQGPAALQLKDILSQALGLAPAAMFVGSDMDIAYRSAFAPGEGYLLYAGTGAIAAFIDEQGQM
ncbi:MAG TPA: ATPase, partial [Roseateles sp.]|nr:ATPase [Roseateles sp.]